MVGLVCAPQFFSDVQIIGNSDRLNSYLNIRFFEIQMIRSLGHVPLWNERMFMGFNATTPHYMIPIVHPLTWIIAASGSKNVIPLFDLYAIVQYAALGLVAYLLINELARDRLIALTGATLYLCSYQVWFRSFQVEDAALNYIMLPAALLLVRKLRRAPSTTLYLLLFLCTLVMLASFLQETSYALLVLGAYVLYCGTKRANSSTLAGAIVVIASAVLAASPRVFGLMQDWGLYARTSQLHFTPEWQVLRLAYDGLFGRNFEEATLTQVHVHEGYAVYSSVFVLPILAVLAPRVSSWRELIVVAGFLALIAAFLCEHLFGLPATIGFPLFFAAVIVYSLGSADQRAEHTETEPDDLIFFVALACLASLMVLWEPAYTLVYRLFLGMDFWHSRLSFVAILGLAVSVSLVLARTARVGADGNPRDLLSRFALSHWPLLFGLLALALICEHFLQWLPTAILGEAPIVLVTAHFKLLAQPLVYLAGMLLLFVSASVIFFFVRHRTRARQVYVLGLCAFLVITAASYANFELFGEPNRTFPIPFRNHNLFVAPRDVFKLPSGETLAAVHHTLDSERYRSEFLLDDSIYKPYVQSYLVQFWQLRSVEGYVPAVPAALVNLPWRGPPMDPRALRFTSADNLVWPILAFLNVKYAVEVDARFFYNIRSVDDHRSFRASDLRLLRNPFHVVPRAFFASRVQPPFHIGTSGNAVPRYAGDAEPGTTAADGQPYSAAPIVTLDGIVLPIDPERVSIVSDIDGPLELSREGDLSVEFRQDTIIAHMDAAPRDRFLVLNEIYHPGWRATADGQPLTIFKANTLMRGVVVPKGTTEVVFTFVPFLATKWALAIFLCGIAAGVAGAWYFGRRPDHGRYLSQDVASN